MRRTGIPVATYWPTTGSTSTNPPVSRGEAQERRAIDRRDDGGAPRADDRRAGSAATPARPGVGGGERVDVVDHRCRPAHEPAKDPADLRELERALHERDERPERDDEQDEPEDHRQHRDELAAGPVALPPMAASANSA